MLIFKSIIPENTALNKQLSVESAETMQVECLAQGHNILSKSTALHASYVTCKQKMLPLTL